MPPPTHIKLDKDKNTREITMYGLGISKGLSLERIRIKGKDHALFKARDGRISMVDAVCPHRGANL